MTRTQIEEAIYFNLKYIHQMNKIKVLLKDALVLKQHIKFLESGNIPKHDFLQKGELCRN